MDKQDRDLLKAGTLWVGAGLGLLLALFCLIVGFIAAGTAFNVWRLEKAGLAKLRQAEQTRQVLVIQAKAEAEAAKSTAEAIHTVGAAAKAFPEYRTQQFIAAFAEAIQHNPNLQLVYVPTEAGLPITEAHRLELVK